MADEHTRNAVRAALAVTARLGLSEHVPEVLHERSNVLVRLGPVVARVPATTALARPEPSAWLARDVAVSRFLTECGVRVVSPTTDPPAGPHFAAGLPVTLWHHTPHDPGHRYAPDTVAGSLAEVHSALRGFPGELPRRGPLDDLERILVRHGDAMDGAAPRLAAEATRIAAELPGSGGRPLHGDAHPGNLIATPGGPCWLDFEDTWHGPLAWDLAILARQGGPEYLAAYPGSVPESELEVCTRLRELFAVAWRYVIAKRFPHRLPEARTALAAYFS
ncbi:phosphotransferase family protein [Amycolatopsis eburnea]|uniref:Aminoglycoside phosphotransferase family protein n=1 Tax=Amycolatopsis eburnea TaxID=2267691 RepID=A0A3R9F6M7_9PSEU|nr:aminoglycoside phosphotransferase family protein [Amycolatopsis eburnea]RSD13707.1 aminoglycoside phosphotransferase family protein [Amycolatopsis eburnea]